MVFRYFTRYSLVCDKQYPVGTKQKGASPNIYLSVTTCANEFVAILAETQLKKKIPSRVLMSASPEARQALGRAT